jgi:RNA polymerase sigma-70 factor (ECF subfamily)
MSGDSFSLNLPLSRLASDACEATTLYQELRKPLLRYLAGLGLSPDEAQDVVQDAFLSLHKHLEPRLAQRKGEPGAPRQDAFLSLHKHLEPRLAQRKGEPGAPRHLAGGGSQQNIRSWLFRVAHNRARNHQQSYSQRMREPLDAVFDAASRDATPEQAALEREKFRRMDKAVRALAVQERECLMLRAEGLRYREIGEVLGIPTSTVADLVERAIKKLAEKCNV